MCIAIWATSLAVVPLYVTSKFGYTLADLGILYSVMSALGIVGGPLGGYIVDTIGRKEGYSLGRLSQLCLLQHCHLYPQRMN